MATNIDKIDISKLDVKNPADILFANMVLDDKVNWYQEKLDEADACGECLSSFATKEEFEEVRGKLLVLQNFFQQLEHEKYACSLNSMCHAIDGIEKALKEISSS